MGAYIAHGAKVQPPERLRALCAAAIVQFALGAVLLRGLQVQFASRDDFAERLISISLPRTPPRPATHAPKKAKAAPAHVPTANAPARGGALGPIPSPSPRSITPVIPVQPSERPSGGASVGTAVGPGVGPGAGSAGGGASGGSDLQQIAGEITPRDYPRHLGNAGIGGRVGISFTVGVTGRVISCRITRSSGIAELDALTCRLIQERFRYRPSTDRYGRPIPDVVEGEQDWTAGAG
jgi:protein TonB